MFFHFLSCSVMFFHVLSCSFMFFHFPSFSFIFLHFPSFSFIFLHFLSFSLSLLGAQNLIFLGPQFRYDFSGQFLCEKSIFGPTPGGNRLGALFLFSSLFSPRFFVFFSCFLFFHFFLFFWFISSFFIF